MRKEEVRLTLFFLHLKYGTANTSRKIRKKNFFWQWREEGWVVVESHSNIKINPLGIILKNTQCRKGTLQSHVFLLRYIFKLEKWPLFMFHCFHLCLCRPRNIMVYNCTTGSTNPFHWGEVGMILPVLLSIRINLKELTVFTEF